MALSIQVCDFIHSKDTVHFLHCLFFRLLFTTDSFVAFPMFLETQYYQYLLNCSYNPPSFQWKTSFNQYYLPASYSEKVLYSMRYEDYMNLGKYDLWRSGLYVLKELFINNSVFLRVQVLLSPLPLYGHTFIFSLSLAYFC